MMRQIQRVAILRKVTFLEKLRKGLTMKGETNLSPIETFAGQTKARQVKERELALHDDRVTRAHGAHASTTEEVHEFLQSRNVDVRMKDHLTQEDVHWAQLVLTLGGDGTFLRATHAFNEAESTPILGINSSPESSFGYYCGCASHDFPALFESLQEGSVHPRSLWRMRALVNNVPHPILVLNDVLFAADTAATTV